MAQYKITSELFGDGGECSLAQIADFVQGWNDTNWSYTVKDDTDGVRVYAERQNQDSFGTPSTYTDWRQVDDAGDLFYIIVAEEIATIATTPAFKADFNNFSELVTNDGTVIRRIEQAGGGATYTIVAESVNPDEFMMNNGEWYEVDEDTTLMWINAVNA